MKTAERQCRLLFGFIFPWLAVDRSLASVADFSNMKTLILALPLLLTFQQTSLPSYGSIDAIKSSTRVYVASENQDSRKRIVKALSKNRDLVVVGSPDEAQFFIEYSELGRDVAVTGERTKERQERGQLLAFILGPDKQKIIVWSESRSRETEDFLGMNMYDSGRNESELTNKFLKALKKAKDAKN